jgi:Mrp family chromosome partitioning ATPase
MDVRDLVSPVADVAAAIDQALRPEPPIPGFVPRRIERAQPKTLPPEFLDACRRAYLAMPATGKVTGVTSATRREGRSSVALGLATILAADTGEPTLLLDCDLEQTTFRATAGCPDAPGLAEWAQGLAQLRVVRASWPDNLYIIPSGASPAQPARVISMLREGKVMQQLERQFVSIVIDLPPILDVAYGPVAAQLADQTLIVVRRGDAHLEQVQKAVALLASARPAGMIINGHPGPRRSWRKGFRRHPRP